MVALDPVLTAEYDDKDVALAVLDPVAVLEAVADEVSVNRADALLLAVPVELTEVVDDALPLPLPLAVHEDDADRLAVVDLDAAGLMLPDAEEVALVLDVALEEGLADRLRDDESENTLVCVVVLDPVAVLEAVADEVSVNRADALLLEVPVELTEVVDDALPLALPLAVCKDDADRLAVDDRDSVELLLPEADSAGPVLVDALAVGVTLDDTLELPDEEPVGLRVLEGDALAVGDDDDDVDGEPEAVAVEDPLGVREAVVLTDELRVDDEEELPESVATLDAELALDELGVDDDVAELVAEEVAVVVAVALVDCDDVALPLALELTVREAGADRLAVVDRDEE